VNTGMAGGRRGRQAVVPNAGRRHVARAGVKAAQQTSLSRRQAWRLAGISRQAGRQVVAGRWWQAGRQAGGAGRTSSHAADVA